MRISGSPMGDVFVDLWGVLADSRRMTPAYRQRAAELLWSRHGGSIEAWLRAHDAAGAWYEAHMASPETWTEGTWIEVVNGADRENVLRLFREAGAPPPEDPLAFSKAFDLEVMSVIDAAFPDARTAVKRLRKAGHRVFVSTNATEANARGAPAVLPGRGQGRTRSSLMYRTVSPAAANRRDFFTPCASRTARLTSGHIPRYFSGSAWTRYFACVRSGSPSYARKWEPYLNPVFATIPRAFRSSYTSRRRSKSGWIRRASASNLGSAIRRSVSPVPGSIAPGFRRGAASVRESV